MKDMRYCIWDFIEINIIRQYKRTADQVYPIGSHYRGATYGADVTLPITTGESNGNPNFKGCIDRNA